MSRRRAGARRTPRPAAGSARTVTSDVVRVVLGTPVVAEFDTGEQIPRPVRETNVIETPTIGTRGRHVGKRGFAAVAVVAAERTSPQSTVR
jgi:hypothetical protein